MKKIDIKKIEEKVLKTALEISKTGEGALFVIGDLILNKDYSLLVKQKVVPFNVLNDKNNKLLKSLAIIDGAVIIDTKGNFICYGAMIKKSKPFVGYGTRHAAAVTASRKAICILCSEEECKVKIFKLGKYVMQVDALDKNIEKNIPKISNVLESLGAGFVGTLGASTFVPIIGIALVPGVLVFGGSYYAIRRLLRNGKKQ